MSESIPVVTRCMEQMRRIAGSVPVFSEKSLIIYGDSDFMDKTKVLKKPCVGVLYEGIRSVSESKESGKKGISSELGVAFVLLFDSSVIGTGRNGNPFAENLMDQLRIRVHAEKAETGHFWRFVLEAPVSEKDGVYLWVQRWVAPIQVRTHG